MLLCINFKELENIGMEQCEKLALDDKMRFENELSLWKGKQPRKIHLIIGEQLVHIRSTFSLQRKMLASIIGQNEASKRH